MQIPGTRPDPFQQLEEPTTNQSAEHEAAGAKFLARPTVVVAGPEPRIFMALSVVDSPSREHPDTEVTLVCAGTAEAEVRAAVMVRYRLPNEDTYDRVPALWNTYILSVPQHEPFDVVIRTLEAMTTDEGAG